MSDMNMRRRDFAAAALLAFTPASALARLKVTSGNNRGGKKSTSTSPDTTKDTTTDPASTTPLEGTKTESYCAPTLNSLGRTIFADWEWTLQRDKTKTYPIQEVVGLEPVRHRFETRSTDSWNGETTRNRA